MMPTPYIHTPSQVTRPNALYLGGEKSLFEALGRAKAMRLVEHVGVIGYTGEQVGVLRFWHAPRRISPACPFADCSAV